MRERMRDRNPVVMSLVMAAFVAAALVGVGLLLSLFRSVDVLTLVLGGIVGFALGLLPYLQYAAEQAHDDTVRRYH